MKGKQRFSGGRGITLFAVTRPGPKVIKLNVISNVASMISVIFIFLNMPIK